MTTLQSTPQLRIAYALYRARQVRHSRDCQCGAYCGYCSPDDKLWCEHMDRELEKLGKPSPPR